MATDGARSSSRVFTGPPQFSEQASEHPESGDSARCEPRQHPAKSDLLVAGTAPLSAGSSLIESSRRTRWTPFERDTMPRLSAFHGIVIFVYFLDHGPPHVHAVYGGDRASFEISTGRVLAGRLGARQMRMVRRWIELHSEELEAAWALACRGEQPGTIEPLP
jgi:hypothetical protein